MGKFGLKIKNVEAAVLYEHNKGIRPYCDFTDAMLSNSLLLDFLKGIGLDVYKDKSTRDVICVKFGFGCASYKDQVAKVRKKLKKCESESKVANLESMLDKIEANKHLYEKISVDDLRLMFYRDGVQITYPSQKKGEADITIHYRMLYRTTGKAKDGSAMFINDRLYDKALDWIRMGIELPEDNAPIVEISAYSSLSASSIIDRINIDPDEILVLKDVDSFFETKAVTIDLDEDHHCVANLQERFRLKNTLFDGQALIDASIFPSWGDGYLLLRHHFCKMAAFHANIQDFFKDWFKDEYDEAVLTDMFGRTVKASKVKLITTDNAMKWLKFNVSFDYWAEKVRANGSLFGIVKTAHASKIGELQRMSYQMVNALDLSLMDEIIRESDDYIFKLRNDDQFFIEFLRQNENYCNDYQVLRALTENDDAFINSEYFKERRTRAIQEYLLRFKNGRLLQNADNLVIVGSPYAMLLHSVGADPMRDPTFAQEDGVIQCWTERFEDGEYLAEFRSPFNSRNNLGHLHNVQHSLLDRYINIGKQCIAVNMIETDFQSRNNGSDMDSDSIYVTNQPQIVECARRFVTQFPTIENRIPKDTNRYSSSIEDFAKVDNLLAKANSAIGESSNLAQLALTYTYNYPDRKYLDYVAILSVLAQVAIDNSKRRYDIDLTEEIKRIKKDMNVAEHGYPYFWFMIKRKSRFAIAGAKEEKKTMKNLNPSLVCPMNYICDYSFSKKLHPNKTLPLSDFFVKFDSNKEKMGRKSKKVEKLIEKYAICLFNARQNDDDEIHHDLLEEKFEELIEDIQSINISNNYLGLMSYLIDRAMVITPSMKGRKNGNCQSNLWRNRPLLLKVLYRINPEGLLSCFSYRKIAN